MTPSTPTLSLILCSRNDQYLGNSRWRLETTLNFIGAEVAALGVSNAVEVVVADWGSDQPLSEGVALDPAAAAITSFLTIPPAVARGLQGDSPFPEVLALNAAARRARGEFIGRIDQDTLVGGKFLRTFLEWVETAPPVRAPLGGALWFANRRSIPYRFAVRCPEFADVARLVRVFGHRLRVETASVFYRSDVGIWLMHRDLWDEAGGYDERMIYMNDMEIDMATRLMARYPMMDLGKLVDYDFYHLDHYAPNVSRSSSTHRAVNAQRRRDDAGMRPSGPHWGLPSQAFETARAAWCRTVVTRRSIAPIEYLKIAPRAAWLAAIVTVDHFRYTTWPHFWRTWTRRAHVTWQALTGQPVAQWPAVLRKLWVERPSARSES